MGRTIVITGASSGIGLALAGRLLERDPTIELCLTVRGQRKADATRDALLAIAPRAKLSFVFVDLARPHDVLRAAAELRARYRTIDILYANAGMMPESTISFLNAFKHLYRGEFVEMFGNGGDIIVQTHKTTPEGYSECFAANVLGHYLLIRELEDCLAGGLVIFTGSDSADASFFSKDDVQCFKGRFPYQSSKYAEELMTKGLQLTLWPSKQIACVGATPGTVYTPLSSPLIPGWLWLLVLPLMALLRLVSSLMTITPFNGSEALYQLAFMDVDAIDRTKRYRSQVRFRGTRLLDGSGGERYVDTIPSTVPDADALEFLKVLEGLRRDELRKFSAAGGKPQR